MKRSASIVLILGILQFLGCASTPPPAATPAPDWLRVYSGKAKWHSLPPMSTARSSFAMGVVGDSLWVADGDAGGTMESLDLRTGTWKSETVKVPKSRFLCASSALQDTLYVVGGFDGGKYYRDLWAFDPAKKSWTGKAPLGTERGGAALVACEGNLYLLGGENFNGVLDTVERFEPASNRWTSLAKAPTARSGVAAAVLDGKIYVVGGVAEEGESNKLECFDPKSNQWTTLAPMPTARNMLSAEALNGKLYALGGVDIAGKDQNTVEVYDPKSNTWQPGSAMPTPRSTCRSAVVQNKLLVAGGTSGNDALRTLELFNP
ncbi:MAG: Kelch repeat-containing protein [Bacteroidota bacterium]